MLTHQEGPVPQRKFPTHVGLPTFLVFSKGSVGITTVFHNIPLPPQQRGGLIRT